MDSLSNKSHNSSAICREILNFSPNSISFPATPTHIPQRSWSDLPVWATFMIWPHYTRSQRIWPHFDPWSHISKLVSIQKYGNRQWGGTRGTDLQLGEQAASDSARPWGFTLQTPGRTRIMLHSGESHGNVWDRLSGAGMWAYKPWDWDHAEYQWTQMQWNKRGVRLCNSYTAQAVNQCFPPQDTVENNFHLLQHHAIELCTPNQKHKAPISNIHHTVTNLSC